MSNSATVPSLM